MRWRAVVAYVPCQVLYGIGCAAAALMQALPDWEAMSPIASAFFSIYQHCMIWSMHVNDWGGLSLWRPWEPNE